MGKCMLWKTTASYVYIAYPKDICLKFNILDKYGIGLLGVSKDGVEEIIKISNNLYKVTELHPVDFEKQSELYKKIKRIIEC